MFLIILMEPKELNHCKCMYIKVGYIIMHYTLQQYINVKVLTFVNKCISATSLSPTQTKNMCLFNYCNTLF